MTNMSLIAYGLKEKHGQLMLQGHNQLKEEQDAFQDVSQGLISMRGNGFSPINMNVEVWTIQAR